MTFIVMAHRTAGSILGAASRPNKGADGKVAEYRSEAEARAEADRLNEITKSPNVYYAAEPLVRRGR